MRREKVIELLNSHRPEIEALGIDHLCIFGSVARDQAKSKSKSKSDVDLVAEFNPTARADLSLRTQASR